MNSDWIECLRWCHRADAPESVDALINCLVDHCRRSSYSQPILSRSKKSGMIRAEGYTILYPGALASIGNLSVEASDDDELSQQLLVDVVRELFVAAFEHGAELVQAISPLIASRFSNDMEPGFISPDPLRDEVLKTSGMFPIAKLVQMEAIGLPSIPKLTENPLSLESGPLAFVAHYDVPAVRWHQLIESTYIETRDVPELNGLRRMEHTLEGYAANIVGVPDTWWLVQCKGLDIGCLLLTRTANNCCELTYFGLTPQWRGKGLSKAIMNYVRNWAIANQINGITLAVDLRNLPAIRLYQSCGFTTQSFVQAWIRFRRAP